jgi:hypothetical protein
MKLSPCFRQHIRAAVSDHGLNIGDDAIVIPAICAWRRAKGAVAAGAEVQCKLSRKNARLPCRGRRG